MAYLKPNTKTVDGILKQYNWSIIYTLFGCKHRITLKGVRCKKEATRFLHKVKEIEKQSKHFPTMEDWQVKVYTVCARQDLIPNYQEAIPTITEGFEELIATKKLHKEITKQQTINAYLAAQSLLVSVIGDLPISQISAIHKIQIEKELHNRSYKDNTINIYSRNVMQFLRWCQELGYLSSLPFTIKQIKVEARTQSWIKPEEFEQIIGHMDKISRSYAVVSYYTGLRKCELNTDPDDEHFNGLYHSLSSKDGLWCLKVHGKGGKVAEVILPDDIKEEYDMMVKPAHRLHPTTISKKFKKACIKAGLSQYRFHDLRHSFCSNQSLLHQDAYLLALKMRHSSLNTTQRYLNDEHLGWLKQVENEQFTA